MMADKIGAEIDELIGEVEKQIGRAVVEAAEDYLLEFIRAARSDGASATLHVKREQLFTAIDAAILAASKRRN